MWLAGPARRIGAAGTPGALKLGFDLKPGMRVGVFGGSFNPAHEGHAHVAQTALTRLGLDRVIWLVSPQNPLKSSHGVTLAARMASARGMARGPSMIVTDVESRFGSTYTIDTLRKLKGRFPGVHFVWIMGADNMANFHRWRGWADIMRTTPMAVVSRPDSMLQSRSAPAARRFAHARRPSREAALLATAHTPAWTYLRAPLNFQSSTALRRAVADLDQTGQQKARAGEPGRA
ncbi:nicotinate-nucleotide adenylyltransferase [Caulobacter sp. S45]|jgi:nicotinate-nucleotide adenylyltransferase|uniref:nicotinate-nucleotide adenylyltransferase n=1 Tax=Caulobacter sp. S45 TaxID=1641861 RepID=UPI00131CE719|nr:nicotinate-nucleotide adenylyltransferase [Caulobacter sp. S45]